MEETKGCCSGDRVVAAVAVLAGTVREGLPEAVTFGQGEEPGL